MLAVSLGFIFGKWLKKYFIGKSLLHEETVKKYLKTLGKKSSIKMFFVHLSQILLSSMMIVV